MESIKNISFYVVLAFVLNIISAFIQSTFLSRFLQDEAVTILVNLLAINTATTGIVLTRLKELSNQYDGFNFSATHTSLKSALFEQVALIALTISALILEDSIIIKSKLEYHDLIFNTVITAIFINAIDTLRDTGKAIFKIMKV